MAQRIRRGGTGVRRQARAQAHARRINQARSQGWSIAGRAMAALPLTDRQWRGLFSGLILTGALALVWFLAGISGMRDAAAARLAAAIAEAGFAVRHIEVHGVEQLDRQVIYREVFGQRNLAMSEVDLAGVRERLMALSWVADARVSRQLPDVLVIDIVEHRPHAVLRRADRLELVNAQGRMLRLAQPGDAERMLLIEGEGAAARMGSLERLLDAAPALRQQVAAARLRGNRRWELTLRTGQQVMLPEGDEIAAAALVAFARADGVHRLIGGKVVSFDLRNAPRMYMYVPGRSEAIAFDEGGQS